MQRMPSRKMDLPIVIGVPGSASRRELMSISVRVDIRDSEHFIAEQKPTVGGLIRRGAFEPRSFIAGIRDETARCGHDIADRRGL